MRSGFSRRFSLVLGILLTPTIGHAQSAPDIFELPLEDVLNISVTSVSKKEQKLSHTPAALFVITQDDIRRSGATNLAEALRMVPGLHVGKLSSHQWAIGSRGFNGLFSNKLLVLMDGRTIYSPTFSGVYWDQQDVILADVERIEVIRGPGATVWGANAVNGVINIISKSTKDTANTVIMGRFGTEEEAAAARVGAKLSEATSARVFAKAYDRDNSVRPNGEDSADSWRGGTGGFKIDSQLSPADHITLQGDVFEGDIRQEDILPTLTPPYSRVRGRKGDYSGGNLLTRWTHKYSDTSDSDLQIYVDRASRLDGTVDQEVDTVDIDFTHRYLISEGNHLVWGANYRRIEDTIRQTDALNVDVSRISTGRDLSSLFVQDEITVIKDTLTLMLGSKFEYHDYGGFNPQPGARVLWTPTDSQSVWASAARAVRTPSRLEHDGIVYLSAFPTQTGLTGLVEGFGNPNFDPEKLVAYEIGYRNLITPDLSVDVALFYNTYDDLESDNQLPPVPNLTTFPPYISAPLVFRNQAEAATAGGEVLVEWRPQKWWRLQGWYSLINIDVEYDEGVIDPLRRNSEGNNVQSQAFLRSLIDLPYNFELDTAARYVDTMSQRRVPSYFELDVRIGWKATENLELALVGQNLLHESHQEFTDFYNATQEAEIERAVYGQATWRF